IQFAGFNLHKWIGAPLTLGFLYIAPERLADIDPDMGEFHYPITDVRARTSYSTPNFPALMTLPLVFEEHRALGGSAAKGALARGEEGYPINRTGATLESITFKVSRSGFLVKVAPHKTSRMEEYYPAYLHYG
ncbi:hypothetical protein, partial [Klebsiella pneumoniae]|uniref:hypothetical protein n=1 Tax=Klebsiella pneumoniae TaxID=573 RepID=UPI0039C1AF6E